MKAKLRLSQPVIKSRLCWFLFFLFFFCLGKSVNAKCHLRTKDRFSQLPHPTYLFNTLTRSLYIDTTLLRHSSRWNERADVLRLSRHQLMIRLTRTLSQELSVSSLTWRRSVCSYLFPDGRTQNPDLTGLCEPSPQDHIKVTQVRSVCISLFLGIFFFFSKINIPGLANLWDHNPSVRFMPQLL